MNIVVIGAQWGDEGKGKIVDYLAADARLIVRFSGGANAGHTIVLGGEQYALHLVPSGILYPDKTVILGTGMVIDPEALFTELTALEAKGVDWGGESSSRIGRTSSSRAIAKGTRIWTPPGASP